MANSKSDSNLHSGKNLLTLTSEHDNLFMEEIAKVATEKYQAIKEQMPSADDETIALFVGSQLFVNSTQP